MNLPLRNLDGSVPISDDSVWFYLPDELRRLQEDEQERPRLESTSLTATEFNLFVLGDSEQPPPITWSRPATVDSVFEEDAVGEMLAPDKVERLQVVVRDRGVGKLILSD